MMAARAAVAGAKGGRISNTQSIGPGAACFIRSRSSSSLPESLTVRRRWPKRRLRSSRTFSLPLRHDARRAHRKRDRDGRAAEIAGGAADQDGLARSQMGGKETAIGDQQRAERAPLRGVTVLDCADAFDVLGRNHHLLGERAGTEVLLQAQ